MPPERKEICDCGTLEDASKESDHPVRWDEKANEYFIAYGTGGKCVFTIALFAVVERQNLGVTHFSHM
jgi:hypothetical protein